MLRPLRVCTSGDGTARCVPDVSPGGRRSVEPVSQSLLWTGTPPSGTPGLSGTGRGTPARTSFLSVSFQKNQRAQRELQSDWRLRLSDGPDRSPTRGSRLEDLKPSSDLLLAPTFLTSFTQQLFWSKDLKNRMSDHPVHED